MTRDLLERRIDRSQPRGAESVWGDVQQTLARNAVLPVVEAEPTPLATSDASTRERTAGLWLYRAAMAVVVAGIAAVAISLFAGGGTTSADLSQNLEPPPSRTGDEPLPAPYAIGDRPLWFVEQPSSALFDADDLFGDSQTVSPATPDSREIVMYAQNDTAFDQGVFRLEFTPGRPENSFSYSWINLEEEQAAQIADLVEATPEGGFALSSESGLVEVARMLTESLWDHSRDWRFVFGDLNESFTLQARGMDDPSIWVAVAQGGGTQLDASEVEVGALGVTGVELQWDQIDRKVLWVEDGFLYILTGWEPSADLDDAVDDLQAILTPSWIANVQAALAGEVVPKQSFPARDWAILIGGPVILYAMWRFRPRVPDNTKT